VLIWPTSALLLRFAEATRLGNSSIAVPVALMTVPEHALVAPSGLGAKRRDREKKHAE